MVPIELTSLALLHCRSEPEPELGNAPMECEDECALPPSRPKPIESASDKKTD